MCSNCNNMNSLNNPNFINGGVGFTIENGNTTLPQNTNQFNNDVLMTNIDSGCFNNSNSCNNNNNAYSNNCGCDCNGNNSCNCYGCNNSCGCNCNGSNNSNINDNDSTNDTLTRNLRNYVGRRITIEVNNCGTNSKKTGVLTCVGRDFIMLRSLNNNNCLLIDTTGLNFVTIHSTC